MSIIHAKNSSVIVKTGAFSLALPDESETGQCSQYSHVQTIITLEGCVLAFNRVGTRLNYLQTYLHVDFKRKLMCLRHITYKTNKKQAIALKLYR